MGRSHIPICCKGSIFWKGSFWESHTYKLADKGGIIWERGVYSGMVAHNHKFVEKGGIFCEGGVDSGIRRHWEILGDPRIYPGIVSRGV